MHRLYKYCVGTLVVFALAIGPALAQDPGTVPDDAVANKAQVTPKSLDDVFATESGQISTSIDGVGTNSSSATVQVDKPSSGATVRRAFLLAASAPEFSPPANELSDVTLSSGSSSLTISRGDYDNLVDGTNFEENGRIEITSFISSVVDPAPAGMVDITVEENDPSDIEGSILVVIFDDPSVSESRSVSLVFGSQDTGGDSFSIGLADPFDDASQDIEMSLGISFGFQPQSPDQTSLIDVNGSRMTSSAGGQDDCDIYEVGEELCENGALLTVGGVGDDSANPDDPNNDAPADARVDDELYTLDEFVDNGATQITVETENPSDDDNIFFAGFTIQGGTGVVGEGITLAPSSATNPVGTDHTVTATVQDDEGNPIEGRDVDFEIMAGPNSGTTGGGITDGNGEATFTWSSSATGTDVVIAETVAGNGDPLTSNEAEKTWTSSATCDVPTLSDDDIDPDNRTLSNTMQDDEGIDVFTFTTLENFTVASIEPSSGFDRTGNTWTWTGMGSPPTSVDFMLEAGPDNTSTYFMEVTDACEDPGPNTVTFDPAYEMGPGVAEAQLMGNAPNPFSGQTTVEFVLPEQRRVTVTVYDMMGRKVATLVDGVRSAGTHAVGWNGQSDDGQDLASGVYLLRMEAGNQSSTQRLTIVR